MTIANRLVIMQQVVRQMENTNIQNEQTQGARGLYTTKCRKQWLGDELSDTC